MNEFVIDLGKQVRATDGYQGTVVFRGQYEAGNYYAVQCEADDDGETIERMIAESDLEIIP